MKLKIKENDFNAAVHATVKMASGRNTSPILSQLLLEAVPALVEAGPSLLRVTGTNLDQTVQITVPAEVEQAGAVSVPAAKLNAIVGTIAGDVEIAVEKCKLSMKSGQSAFKLLGMPADEFPSIPKCVGEEISLPQKVLKRLLAWTSFAMSTDQSRYVLNGLLFKWTSQQIIAVGTDGRRLARATHIAALGKPGEALVPDVAVKELARLVSEKDEPATIRVTDSHIQFGLGNTVLTSKLIDGQFPNYNQVIPTEFKQRIPLPNGQFTDAVRRVSLMTTEKAQSIRLEAQSNRITLKASAPDLGDAREDVDAKYSGPPIAIAFNADYLAEPLGIVKDDVELSYSHIDELSPGKISNGDESFMYIIMPMRMS